MECERSRQAPAWYVIRIKSTIDPAWADWFEGMQISQTGDGESLLSGELADQCALYGILEKIHSLNLCLLSVRKFDIRNEQE